MGWAAPLFFALCGVLALCVLVSPNGVRRSTGRLAPVHLRRPDLAPRQVLWWRVGMALVLIAVIAWFLLNL
jgi:hypothetical protein